MIIKISVEPDFETGTVNFHVTSESLGLSLGFMMTEDQTIEDIKENISRAILNVLKFPLPAVR